MIKNKVHASHEPLVEPSHAVSHKAGTRPWLHSLERFTRLLFGSSENMPTEPSAHAPDHGQVVDTDQQPVLLPVDAEPAPSSIREDACAAGGETPGRATADLLYPHRSAAPSRVPIRTQGDEQALSLEATRSDPLAPAQQASIPRPDRIDAVAPAASTDESLPDWQGQVVDDVLRLTRRASSSMQNWTITLPLRSDVLPDSILRIEAWPHSLSLRFATTSPVSHGRIHAHRHRLEALLAQRLNRRYQIDVDVV